jgi:hypothetical protein
LEIEKILGFFMVFTPAQEQAPRRVSCPLMSSDNTPLSPWKCE